MYILWLRHIHLCGISNVRHIHPNHLDHRLLIIIHNAIVKHKGRINFIRTNYTIETNFVDIFIIHRVAKSLNPEEELSLFLKMRKISLNDNLKKRLQCISVIIRPSSECIRCRASDIWPVEPHFCLGRFPTLGFPDKYWTIFHCGVE